MLKPVIKKFNSTDHDPIETWKPDDPYDVDIRITFAIGFSNEDGADYFDGHFITKNHEDEYSNRFKYFLIEKFSLNKVLEMVTLYIESCGRDEWNKTATEINKKLYWEFDNYISHDE